MAREFVRLTIGDKANEAFESESACRAILGALEPSPDHFFWFEYNFLFVLAADGSSEKASLGDHSATGYRQRSRFYEISDEGRLLYAQRVAEYILFLAETTGISTAETCDRARGELQSFSNLQDFLGSIQNN
jgi:hypothetical protein